MRTREEQTAAIKADQQFWRELAAEVGPDRFDEPGTIGEWSFGELAGHLLGWRNRTIARLEAAGRGHPDPLPDEPDTDDEIDAFNVQLRDSDSGRPSRELVDAYTDSYDRLIRALDALPESTLTDGQALAWTEGKPLIEIPFTGHLHDEHLPDVRAWLGAKGRGPQ